MTGLMLKDLLVMRKTLKTYALFLAFYAALAAVGALPLAAVTAMVQIIIMMLPIAAFSYDELAKWDRYVLTLPLGHRTVVKARYLFTLLMSLGAAALGLLTCVLLSLFRQESLGENLASVLICLALGLFIADVMLPLCYKLGPERARPYLYLVVFLPVILLFITYKLGFLNGLELFFLSGRSEGSILALFSLLPLAALAGLWASYLAACRVVEAKEF